MTAANSLIDDHPRGAVLAPRMAPLAIIVVITLAFRIAGYLKPSPFIVIPDSVSLPINMLGLVFLVCGVWAWRASPSPLSRLFLITGLSGCIHWGGAIGFDNTQLDVALLFFYIAVTILGDTALLDFALRYPDTRARRARAISLLYGLSILALALVPITPFLSSGIVETMVGLLIGLGVVISVVAGITFLAKWFRAESAARRSQSLTVIVGAMILSTALDLLGDAHILPGTPEAWDPAYAIVPITLAWALVRLGHSDA